MLAALAACAPAPESRSVLPPMAAAGIGVHSLPLLERDARFTDMAFVAEDGTVLPLRHWEPEGEPRAVILALHGLNDYSFAFDGPARNWARHGIATYAYDQRGFGLAPDRGHWPGRAALAADAAAASRILRARYPGTPLYLLGESMGGAVAIIAATGESGTLRPDVDGVILSAPAIWGRSLMGLLPRLALWSTVRLFPEMTLTGRGLRVTPTDNKPLLRMLQRDPLVIKETRVDTLYRLADLMDAAFAAAPSLQGRILLIYGAKDDIVPKSGMRDFVSMLPRNPEHRLAWYRRGYHMLMRDLEADTVNDDVAAWALHPKAPLPSGADGEPAQAFAED